MASTKADRRRLAAQIRAERYTRPSSMNDERQRPDPVLRQVENLQAKARALSLYREKHWSRLSTSALKEQLALERRYLLKAIELIEGPKRKRRQRR